MYFQIIIKGHIWCNIRYSNLVVTIVHNVCIYDSETTKANVNYTFLLIQSYLSQLKTGAKFDKNDDKILIISAKRTRSEYFSNVVLVSEFPRKTPNITECFDNFHC